ncbi:MAG: transcription termination factor NusA [Thermodesulfobacteriota bacterium]
MFVNLNSVLAQVEKDKGLDQNILIEALESAMLVAAKKRFGSQKDIEARFNEESGEIELFQFKTVVEEVEDNYLEISIEETKELDPEAELGDSIGIKLDTSGFGRIAAQTAKQVIIQKVREAERDQLYSDYKDKVGELVTGLVQRIEKGNIIVNIGRGETLLPKREQVKKEGYRQGDRIKAIIIEVDRSSKRPQIIISRTRPEFLVKLFEIEVPEIFERIVSIKGAAREPGERAKIAVVSQDKDVDAVGACVGMKGMRVQNVVQELRGEKIDIVSWKEEPAEFVCNALSPAQISRVVIDEADKRMEVIVPDDQLSLAIGKKGQNVRLAAKLTSWRIDIHSESDIKKLTMEAKDMLAKIPGIGKTMIEILYANNFRSVKELTEADIDDLTKIPGVGQKTAEKIIAGARELTIED